MKISIKYIVLAILILFLGTFVIGGWLGYRRANNAIEPTIDSLNAKISHYTVELNNKTIYVTEVEQEMETLKQAIRDGDVEKEELRKLNIKQINELTRLRLRIDTLLADIEHSGEIVFDLSDLIIESVIDSTDKYNSIKLPFHFNKKDKWLDLYGAFSSEGKLDISLKMDAPIDVWGVLKKKEKTPSVMVTSENPYIKTLTLSSIKFDMPKTRRYGIGINVGYGITKEATLSPYIGVGLSYNLIRF